MKTRSIIFNWRLYTRNCFINTAQESSHRLLVYPSYCTFSKREPERGINAVTQSFLKTLSSHNSVKKFSKVVEVDDDKEKKDNSTVIYYGPLTSRIKGVKVFTCLSSLAGIALQPLIMQNILSGENLVVAVPLCTCVGFFTFVTPFLIHSFTKKYVTEIEYNSETDTYKAVTLSFFLRKINITFKVEDVSVPNLMPLFTTMCIKGKPLFVISDSFLEVKHYIRMMGYDKPIDLQLNTSSSVDKTQKEAVEVK